MQPKLKLGKGAEGRILLIGKDGITVAMNLAQEEDLQAFWPGGYEQLLEKRVKMRTRYLKG